MAREHTTEDGGTDDRQQDETGPIGWFRSALAAVGAGAGGEAAGAAAGTTSSGSPALAFAADTTVDTRATTDGDWAEPGVWDDGVPGDGDNAAVDPGVTVTLGSDTARVSTWRGQVRSVAGFDADL